MGSCSKHHRSHRQRLSRLATRFDRESRCRRAEVYRGRVVFASCSLFDMNDGVLWLEREAHEPRPVHAHKVMEMLELVELVT